MKVSEEEVRHIARLASLEIAEEQVKKYRENLEDILNFAEVVNNADTEGIDVTVGANEACNVFRKDEVKAFEDTEALLQNAKTKERNMFKIPKVINN